MSVTFEAARAVADAVAYEGYVLYPYRASAAKNQVRWQFGVLVPPACAAARPDERAALHVECLAEPTAGDVLRVQARFLQLCRRQVERRAGSRFVPVERLEVGGALHTSFDEAVPREVDAQLPVADLLAGVRDIPVACAGSHDDQPLAGGAARVVRHAEPLEARLQVAATRLEGPYGGVSLRVRVDNTAPDHLTGREEALPRSLLAAHVLLGLRDGTFLSLADPPEWASPAARACLTDGAWPALLGDPRRPQVVLASPIILADFPEVAPESPGDWCDATEIDELLALRTMALTDEEKREARGTDPRARDIIDRADHLPPEVMERLHGAIRSLRPATPATPSAAGTPAAGLFEPTVPWWDPGADASVNPQTDTVTIAGVAVGAGSRVRLRPGARRADAQDLFLVGRTATVAAVLTSVDEETWIAVSVDDDPAAEEMSWHGRYRYFTPEEIEVLQEEDLG